jgi:hypothetical protein
MLNRYSLSIGYKQPISARELHQKIVESRKQRETGRSVPRAKREKFFNGDVIIEKSLTRLYDDGYQPLAV